MVIAALVLVVAGVVLAIVFLAIDRTPRERMTGLDVVATVNAAGDIAIVETFTWDFDTATRSQILRTIPTSPAAGRSGVVPVREVGAASATASTDLSFEPQPGLEVAVIGDPGQSLTGAHDYRLSYVLGAVAAGRAGDATVELNLIGTLSEVPIDDASVTLTVPGGLLGDVGCSTGAAGSTTPCTPSVVEGDDRTTITLGPVDLEPGQGVSMFVVYDAPIDPAPPVQASTAEARTTVAESPPTDEGLATEPVLPPPAGSGVMLMLVGLPLMLVGGAGVAWSWVRRHGRDRRWAGSAVDAVFGSGGSTVAATPPAAATVGEAEAHRLVTVAFVPPRDVRPGEGGALWRLRAGDDDRVATLVDLAIRDWFIIDESNPAAPELVWSGHGDPSQLAPYERTFLNGLFPTSDIDASATHALPPRVVLGKYSSAFSSAWSQLRRDLDGVLAERQWLRDGALMRTLAAVAAGLMLGSIGLMVAVAMAGGRVAGQTPMGWAVVLPPMLVVGLGIGTLLAAGGMRARTPDGFSVWAQVEGLRLFMEGSEGEHARQAAERGMLRHYVAWAVALSEVDRWKSACAQAGTDPTEGWMLGGVGLGVGLGRLHHGSSVASTQPGSSGAGGGFSGSVGGGAGGGGFGSR